MAVTHQFLVDVPGEVGGGLAVLRGAVHRQLLPGMVPGQVNVRGVNGTVGTGCRYLEGLKDRIIKPCSGAPSDSGMVPRQR